MNAKRLTLLASLFVFSAGTTSADYLYIKIDVDKLNFFPEAKGMGKGGGMMGMMGGGPMGGGPMGPGGPMGGAGGGFQGGKQAGGFMGAGGGFQGGKQAGGFQGGKQFQGGSPFGPSIPKTIGGKLEAMFPIEPKEDKDKDEAPDPNAKWLTVFVEIKGQARPRGAFPLGSILAIDHKWGTDNLLLISKQLPVVGSYFKHEDHGKEFDILYLEDKRKENKDVERYLYLARWALKYGLMKKFHELGMKEAIGLNRKHPVVAEYLRVKKALESPFKEVDPTQEELLKELHANGYKPHVSEKGHFVLYAQPFASADRNTDSTIKRRLAMMETTLETFYYWFAMQGKSSPQPPLPKYRLAAVMVTSKDEFHDRHLQWGGMPMTADGFTPRRANLLVMPTKARQTDPRFVEFETILTSRLADANAKLQQLRIGITYEDLLTGEVKKTKLASRVAEHIALAQTAVLLHKALEEEAERATITNECVRQILTASEMFPRNVQIPDWIVEGLSAFFETSMGSAHLTVGTPNWAHLISFKHLLNTKQLDKAPDVLYNVITDRYFNDARQLSAESLEHKDDEALKDDAKRAWEMARSTAWAFVFHLAEHREMGFLFRYGKELDKLPRDLDLDTVVLQTCFANAFDIPDPKNARRIEPQRLTNLAENWFTKMHGTNLEILAIQTYLLKQRALQDADPEPPAADNPMNPMKMGPMGGGPMMMPMMMPMPMKPMPMPMAQKTADKSAQNSGVNRSAYQRPASSKDKADSGKETTGAAPGSKVIANGIHETTADAIGKEMMKSSPPQIKAKYKDDAFRISGKVEGKLRSIVLLSIAGEKGKIMMDFHNEAAIRDIKLNSTAIIEGRFDGVVIDGPYFTKCRLVKAE